MKAKIHPTYYSDAQAVCACGSTFITGSTKQTLTVEACIKCHPFYTGEHKFLDRKGRVDSFEKKRAFAVKYKASNVGKKEKNNKSEKSVKSLRELLGE